MTKTIAFLLGALILAGAAHAQTAPPPAVATRITVSASSSSEKVRENPAGQYVLVKTVVGQVMGVLDARARPIEPGGYNLLKYCWTPANVLGDWAERAGLTGRMVVAAIETRSWQRDLVRAGYSEKPVAEAIGRYEAMLVAAGFTDAARTRAVEGLVTDLDALRAAAPGAAKIHAVPRCKAEETRSLGLRWTTLPKDGRARFIPYVLHQICHAQDLAADDPVRCDYWLDGKAGEPMGFAGEAVYSVRWQDGSTATGRFDPDESRSDGTVTLRLRPTKAK
ncbi:hypothetical protein [Reyranella sp.]|uniref:hypothetical protein n=1 Tax=Reyranella sp. TaxID=1929291 RepID=UPI003BAC9B96